MSFTTYQWQSVKTLHISKVHNVQETHKNSFKTNWQLSSSTSNFAILVDFAFQFWYKALTLCRESYQKYISVKFSFLAKNHYVRF